MNVMDTRATSAMLYLDGVHVSFDGFHAINNLSLTLEPGEMRAIIGPNGAGKTTLFRMIVGDEKPDGGSIRLGDTVQLAYVDQSRDALDPDKTVWEEISDGDENITVGNGKMNSRAYVGGFNFKGSDQQRKVGVLSGGERNRVHLAKLLKSGGNLLLLDEPTNDLDVDTLRALEDALLNFAGCAVVISHDRWFLDRVATHILAFEGDSQVVWFEGNLEAYEENKRNRLGAEADRPLAFQRRQHRVEFLQRRADAQRPVHLRGRHVQADRVDALRKFGKAEVTVRVDEHGNRGLCAAMQAVRQGASRGVGRCAGQMVCVGFAEEIEVPRISSIFSLSSRVFSSVGKRTPTPWVRPPDALAGVIQPTLPATG